MKPNSPLTRSLGATLGGAAVGGVAVASGVPLLLAAAIGAATYYGLTLVFAPRRFTEQPGAPEDANAVLGDAAARVKLLAAASAQLPAALGRETTAIANTANQIIADIAEQPQKLDSGRRFLTHYLDSTQTVLDYYQRLKSRQSTQLTASLESKVASVLALVRQGFQDQRESLMADDVLRLSTELEVLQQTLELEGGAARRP